jgi:hypothetical protein
MNEQPVDIVDETKWRVTLDLREGPGGAVAVYPKKGEDPKADLLARSIAQNAGDKLTEFGVKDDESLKELLTRTIKGVDIYHLYKAGKFEHYDTVDELMSHLHTPAEAEPEVDPRALESDSVNHPPHYTKGGIECIDAIDAAVANKPGGEAPYVANVIKYVWRYNDKGGVESLRKARWYLDRLISKLETTPEVR